MLYSLLLFGTPWFWLAWIVPYIVLTAFVENEKAVSAFLTVLITAAVWIAFGGKDILPWLSHHPKEIAIGVGVYLVMGIVWSFVKWFFYVMRIRDGYEVKRAQWIKTNGPIDDTVADPNKITSLPKKNATKREAFLYYMNNCSLLPPRAVDNKGRITFWMGYWPASAIWTLLNDPIRRLWTFVYNRIGHLFEKLSKAIYSKYYADFTVKDDSQPPQEAK